MSLPSTSIDDMNTTLIQYNGNWEGINGSTRQWDGSIHATGQAGATATFQFRGHLLWVWGTIPAGAGKNLVQLTIDGGTANITSQTSNASAVFNVLYFETPLLPETFHTAVITNLGSTTNGSTEFQLDRFEFQTTDVTPLFSPPGGSTTSQTPLVTTFVTPIANSAKPSSSSKSSLGAIAGGVIGALALVIVFLLFLLWRRKKRESASSIDTVKRPRDTNIFRQRSTSPRHSSLLPTPFPLNHQADTMSQNHSTELIAPTPTASNSQPSGLNVISISEKSGYRNFRPESTSPLSSHSPTNTQSSSSRPPGLTSSTMITFDSNSAARPIASSPIDNESSSEFRERRDHASIHHHPLESPQSVLSSSADIYDHPPPSYWHNNNENESHSPL
ncbi:hypothetical protein BYT27DRAFT_7264751 [Phlegmacium glaucopus]|nr:hypothetical protein BYT27DRAFT_7264751 [Phlegmacium glaucopus]